MEEIKIGLLGLGTVGAGVVRIVEGHQAELQRQTASKLVIEKILVQDKNKPRDVDVPIEKLTSDPNEIIHNPEIDIIVEVIGGVDRAKKYILEALENGKHIVTANKDLMALHGQEILHKAAEKKCDVFYEASVAGGIPILRTLVEGLSSDRITKIMGIVNGTTNYILTKMSKEGADYAEALREAQALGYAEADPTSDVEGLDAARKMTILATLGFQTKVALTDVEVKGIRDVTVEDIQYGRQLGYEVKLLGIAEKRDDFLSISVQPTMIKQTHPLAAVRDVFNAVYVYGEAVGETMFYGPGAGALPTATSIVADLVAVVRNSRLHVSGQAISITYKEKKMASPENTLSKYFVRLHVEDRPGVLAQITQIFAENDISLESVLQPSNAVDKPVELIITTHEASLAGMKKVLDTFESVATVHSICSIYRLEC